MCVCVCAADPLPIHTTRRVAGTVDSEEPTYQAPYAFSNSSSRHGGIT